MAVYWMTEVLPLGVTALLPIILFPIFGIRKSRDVTPNYMKVNVFVLFIFLRKKTSCNIKVIFNHL